MQTEQPECAQCGQSEITSVHAAARGWRRIFGRLLCGTCARRFPSWMS